ncbi:hypothetical protein [Botrimarina sp.]|uniref:hypothetical protein n=1 Tax=Botrimarina sp. TaxID=2795802 RepID=UPI0032EFB352
MSSQASWLMPYKRKRDAAHVPTLWRFYRHCLQLQSAAGLDVELFDACCSLRQVGVVSLTMGMFWCRPEPRDLLTEVLCDGARRLLAQAVEAEVAEWIDSHADASPPSSARRSALKRTTS